MYLSVVLYIRFACTAAYKFTVMYACCFLVASIFGAVSAGAHCHAYCTNPRHDDDSVIPLHDHESFSICGLYIRAVKPSMAGLQSANETCVLLYWCKIVRDNAISCMRIYLIGGLYTSIAASVQRWPLCLTQQTRGLTYLQMHVTVHSQLTTVHANKKQIFCIFYYSSTYECAEELYNFNSHDRQEKLRLYSSVGWKTVAV